MSDSKGEGGSWLYGLILIIAGAFILITGILNIVGFNPIYDLLPTEYQYLAGISGYTNLAIGAWGLIGGVGLIKDQEWGWGISLVVLSLVIVTFIVEVIAGFMAITTVLYDINFWIKFVALIISAIGMVYLLITKEKYA
ncbi:MAG: hypothetical protein GF329_07555 [Candidatus Lokiarchaeota archaeon]|nr:hypothetical protein [Candidatus Lokiarchaeota archaeon]